MIPIGTIVYLPRQLHCAVFANYGASVGLERLTYQINDPKRYFWVEEKVVRKDEPPSEEEVRG